MRFLSARRTIGADGKLSDKKLVKKFEDHGFEVYRPGRHSGIFYSFTSTSFPRI
jgi:hypothetical protein